MKCLNQNPVTYCNMAIYCNTIKHNTQYSIDPHCFTLNTHICTYTHTYIHMHTYTHTHTYIHIYIHTYIYAYAYACKDGWTNTSIGMYRYQLLLQIYSADQLIIDIKTLVGTRGYIGLLVGNFFCLIYSGGQEAMSYQITEVST